MQSLAMLDAIVEPEWDYRRHSFNQHWSAGEMMGSWRDGEGDDLFVLFKGETAYLKGFDHEAADQSVSPRAFYDELPASFAEQASEPAFSPDDVTYIRWCGPDDGQWRRVILAAYADGSDGSADMLAIYGGSYRDYCDYARDYFEVDLDAGAVKAIYAFAPLDEQLVTVLSPGRTLAELAPDAEEIGYPLAG